MKLRFVAPIAMTEDPGPSQQPPGEPASGDPTAPGDEEPSQKVDDSGNSGGGGCLKWVVGCGCLTVILLMILGGAAAGLAFFKAPDAVGADGWGEIGELVQTATRVADESQRDDGDGGGLAQMAAGDGADDEAGDIDDFFDLLDIPVTAAELSGFQTEVRDWEQRQAVDEFKELVRRAEELEEEDQDSIFAALRVLRVFTEFAFAANDLGRDFAGFGDADFHRTNSRMVAVVRISHFGAADTDYEAYEQSVADALLDDHDEHREDYETTRELIEESADDGDFDPEDLSEEQQQELMEAFAEQFLFINSAINRQTLESWAALSDDERQEIVDYVDAPHNHIARFMAAAHVEEPQTAYHWHLFAL